MKLLLILLMMSAVGNAEPVLKTSASELPDTSVAYESVQSQTELVEEVAEEIERAPLSITTQSGYNHTPARKWWSSRFSFLNDK